MKKLISLFLASLLSAFTPYLAKENDNKISYEPTSKTYYETVDKSEIAELLAELELNENPDEVDKIVYIDYETLDFPNGIPDCQKSLWGNDIVFRNIESKVAMGPLLRSSTFTYPGGSMTVSESVGVSCSLSTTVNAEFISSQIGFDVTASVTVTDTQNVSVPKEGKYRTCNAYVRLMRYTFDIYEDDLFFDDFLGTGTIDRPTGIFFVIRTETKPLLPQD